MRRPGAERIRRPPVYARAGANGPAHLERVDRFAALCVGQATVGQPHRISGRCVLSVDPRRQRLARFLGRALSAGNVCGAAERRNQPGTAKAHHFLCGRMGRIRGELFQFWQLAHCTCRRALRIGAHILGARRVALRLETGDVGQRVAGVGCRVHLAYLLAGLGRGRVGCI